MVLRKLTFVQGTQKTTLVRSVLHEGLLPEVDGYYLYQLRRAVKIHHRSFE